MSRGVTLMEFLTALSIFSIVGTVSVTMFSLSGKYYQQGAAAADVQAAALTASPRFIQAVQESDPSGFAVDTASHNAILLISPRTTSGAFKIYTSNDGLQTQFYGMPYWQKWVCYYLSASGSTWNLVKKEGNPLGSILPNPAVPAPPAGWKSTFINSSLNAEVVAQNVQTFYIQDINCGVTGNPLYIKFATSETYAGLSSSFNPGRTVTFNCAGQTGNWMQVQMKD